MRRIYSDTRSPRSENELPGFWPDSQIAKPYGQEIQCSDVLNRRMRHAKRFRGIDGQTVDIAGAALKSVMTRPILKAQEH